VVWQKVWGWPGWTEEGGSGTKAELNRDAGWD
jgi:hypothetical protein